MITPPKTNDEGLITLTVPEFKMYIEEAMDLGCTNALQTVAEFAQELEARVAARRSPNPPA